MTERPLRLLIVNRNCAPSVGGIQTFIDTLGRWLAAQGVEVTVAATRMPRTTPSPDVPYHVIYRPTWAKAWRLLRQADVVQFNVFDYAWWVLAALLRKRTVFIYHSPSRICPKGVGWNGREHCRFETHWRQCLGCLRRDRSWRQSLGLWASFPLKRWLVDARATVINVSSYTEQTFRVPKSVTIRYGLDMGKYAPAAASARTYLLFVGRLIPEKGCDVLLEAYARCHRQGVRLPVLEVIGDGPQRPALEARSQTLSLSSAVRFRGAMASRQVIEQMQQAIALVVPSVWPETLGLVAVEAMLCGTPVIASGAAGLQETAGIAGVTFPAGNVAALSEQLIRVVADPQLQADMRSRGLALGRTFSQERMASEHLALYRHLANGRHG